MNTIKTELRISYLIAAALQETITPVEQAELDTWLAAAPKNRAHFEEAYQGAQLQEKLRQFNSADKKSVWNKTQAKIKAQAGADTAIPIRRLSKWRRSIAAAAAILILGLAGIYLYQNRTTQTEELVAAQDIAPAKEGTTLTLADGTTIQLEDALAGNIAEQSGVKISKTADGQIRYQITGDDSEAIGYNTLKTKRGEQIQVVLPDETIVYLNAESALEYPTRFTKPKREVSLIGEAYFEVAKDQTKPFIVKSREQEITVTGTQFNVNSYSNERSALTTLVEGQVRIKDLKSGDRVLLIPGQQAVSSVQGLAVKTVNTDDFTAWKENYFVFESQSLPHIIRQLERWYNIEVDYKHIPHDIFSARIKRDKNINAVLHALSKTSGINFYVKERRIMVKP